jgi:hypothetical protein
VLEKGRVRTRSERFTCSPAVPTKTALQAICELGAPQSTVTLVIVPTFDDDSHRDFVALNFD